MWKFTITIKAHCRQLSSDVKVALKPGGVDLKNKLVYGGDLPVATSKKSFGSILFERLMKKERQDQILQICTETKHKMTTKKYLQNAVAVAEKLRENGIQKGDFILLVGNNSLNMNAALTGIFFIGAVPVPITYKTSIDEFKVLMKYIKPKFFACDKKYLFSFRRALEHVFEYESSKIFLLDYQKDAWDTEIQTFGEFVKGKGNNLESFKPAEVENPQEELALVMKALTDGSIGRGVGITHHNLNSVIARYDSKDPEVLASSVVLMVQKVMWMTGIYALLWGCCYGTTLVVMSEFEEEKFMKAIHDYRVTSTFLYSPRLWQLYKYDFKENYDLSSCKDIYIVDGIVHETLIEGIKEKTGITVKPSVGISELTGFVLTATDKNKVGSSGRLEPQVYGKVISDETHQKVGPKKKGEICFKGPTLTKGYINDQKSTRALFDKEGFLCSGNYGYYDEDGDFFIIDRIHYVIKYKTYKVSPKELEGIIKSLDSVKDVAVSGIKHPSDGYYPIAFVVLQKGKSLTTDFIISHVNEHVLDYKRLRGGVIFVSKIPRSRDNGIIKRNILKKILSKYRIREEVLQPKPKSS